MFIKPEIINCDQILHKNGAFLHFDCSLNSSLGSSRNFHRSGSLRSNPYFNQDTPPQANERTMQTSAGSWKLVVLWNLALLVTAKFVKIENLQFHPNLPPWDGGENEDRESSAVPVISSSIDGAQSQSETGGDEAESHGLQSETGN